MDEATLQYIWQYQLFNANNLKTIDGEPVQIIRRGTLNSYGGPDFSNAQIKIGETEWFGHVEIHLNSSDWYNHKHQKNDDYKNVILHVVLNLHPEKNPNIPTLVLHDRVSSIFQERYKKLKGSQSFIACEQLIHQTPEFEWIFWKERLILERLTKKSKLVKQFKQENKNDSKNSYYQFLCYNLGLKTNSDAMLELARQLPLKLIAKYRNNLLQLEALLFGTANLLSSEIDGDSYFNLLKKEFKFLQKKHGIVPIQTKWNFGGLYPHSQPTIRIAQLATLFHVNHRIIDKLTQEQLSRKEIQLFFTHSPSDYWHTHYSFQKSSTPKNKIIGKSKTDSLIINFILPIWFLISVERLDSPGIDFEFITQSLKEIPKEKNSIIKRFNQIKIESKNAYDTQALLELHKEYCSKKRCLSCRIGHYLLNKET